LPSPDPDLLAGAGLPVGIPADIAERLDPILNGRLPIGTWDIEKRRWTRLPQCISTIRDIVEGWESGVMERRPGWCAARGSCHAPVDVVPARSLRPDVAAAIEREAILL
jgi:hypothetical protein